MIKLTTFIASDFDRLISWIDSKELLLTIAGNVFTYPLTSEQLQIYLDDKASHAFNILDLFQNKIIGHAELLQSAENVFKIDKLIIGDTDNRGKGIGQKVITELLDYAFIQLNATSIELNVFDWNIGGIKCYEKCGFIINPGKQAIFYIDDKSWTALNMIIDKDAWATATNP